jgi:hypothetical protein
VRCGHFHCSDLFGRTARRLSGAWIAVMEQPLRSAHVSPHGSLIVLLLSLSSAVSSADNDEPATARFACDIPNLVILADDRQDAKSACEGARAALGFLAAVGLDVSSEIRIEIVPDVTEHASHAAAGCFLASSQKVMALSYTEFRAFEQWFGIPVDRALYRALIAHETAHLIASCNFKRPKPPIQAQEYIAYVTMLATMEPAQRERVLNQFPGDGYETQQQMNATIYLCDPMRFGVQAYRHFLKEGNGAEFIRAILAGNALAE